MTLRKTFGAAGHPVAVRYRDVVARQAAERLAELGDATAAPALAGGSALAELPEPLRGGHVVFGDFDGVHRAHVRAIEYARSLSRLRLGPVIALSCERATHTSGFRLTERDETARLAARAGADAVVTVPVGEDRPLTPGRFVTELLKRRLDAKSVVISHDGVGDGLGPACIPEIARIAPLHGVTVHILPPILDPDPITSDRARLSLSAGDVESTSRVLGRFWLVEGVVFHGAKRGRELGMPTANVAMPADSGLAYGVYAVRALVGRKVHDGVASFGRRPQFDNGEPLLEVHLLDFDGDLYGETLRVEFIDWIRGEETFPSIADLKARMTLDALDARSRLDGASGSSRSALSWTGRPPAHCLEF